MDNNKGEIVLYQPNDTVAVEVRLEDETVWLTQAQIAELFGTKRPAITKHLKNIFECGELDERVVSSILELTTQHGAIANKTQTIQTKIYNLDVILSVGYRVNSINATLFRRWANQILKDYILRGYAINHRIDRLESKIVEHDQKFDLLIKTALPPVQGVFFDGQIFDAYVFASDLIKSAKKSIILIDNYVDETVLVMLSDRKPNVTAKIYTWRITEKLQLSLTKHCQQYEPIEIEEVKTFHDRFLIIDNTVYAIGASMKDLGKRLFAFFKMEINPAELMKNIRKLEVADKLSAVENS
ncbi:MAG: virulence RhuM family protein [Chitinispirillia bacterium]|nr:virulence RhuM family protein [Chitinispirillia bacterium]